MRKYNGTKRSQGTFKIDKNVRLIAINRELTMTLMRLIAIKYFNCLTALLKIYISLFVHLTSIVLLQNQIVKQTD